MAIVYVSTVILGAQASQTTTAQSGPNAEPQITVTGCLQPAQPSPTGTTGATATTADASDAKFMLTKIEHAPDTTTASPTASPQAYRLIANPEALSPHVGKKLELTGVVEKTSSAGATSTAAGENESPSLRVMSGKVISASCGEGPADR
jgi:hypothetical protein